MPFTPSHVAAVLPALRPARTGVVRGRGPWVAAGLVAGSLAPDAPFFADSLVPGCHGFGRVTHGAAGMVLADPLIAAGLAAGWAAVRGPLVALLPPGARTAVERLSDGTAAAGQGGAGRRGAGARAGWFWVSAAMGAATHGVWDAFKHEGRWGVRVLPVLDRRVGGVPVHHAAQYAGSAAGLLVTGRWLRDALRGAGERGGNGERVAPGGGRTSGAGQTAAVYVPRFVSTELTARQRRAGRVLMGGAMVAGAAARCRRDRPSDPSALIAAVSFGAGGWAAAAAAAWALAARAAPGGGACRNGPRRRR